MKSVLRLFALGGLVLLLFAAPASAQYLFLDTNGDAMRTSADVMNPNGTPTTVDIYLVTNENRDGSTAVCNSDPTLPLTINSYVLNLAASGGTVTFASYTNQIAEFTIALQPLLSSTTELTVGFGSGTALTPGTYFLGRVTVTGVTGAPSLAVLSYGTLQVVNATSFGGACTGIDFDNTYKLGTDWTDADGLPAAAGGNAGPEISAPTTATATEGVAITPIVVNATDTDLTDVLTITQTGAPASLTLTTTPGTSPASATLSGTPSFSDQGSYAILWSVSDGTNPPDTMTTVLTIANVDRTPTVTSPTTATGSVGGAPITFVVTANDPDDDFILALAAAPLPEGATFTTDATNTSGTFTWSPTATQTGVFNLTFTANNALTGSSVTEITVTGSGDTAPEVAAVADVSIAENATVTIPVAATDADNDAITLTANLPAFATLNEPTTGTGSVSTSITLSPGVGTSGTYLATVTATANGIADTDSFQIVVGGSDTAPVVTAPSNVSGDEGSVINFSVSVTDPEGDAITSLIGSPLPAGATFAPNAGNTGGTFSWSPTSTQAGSYSITWTASNALTGTTTTTITVNNLDQPPTLVPIGDVTVAEGASTTINVLAQDQDGEMITLTSDLPSFATLNPPTSGDDSLATTITISPGAGDAGTYSASVTATAGAGTVNETFIINVTSSGSDQAPTVTAPLTVSGTEGVLTTITVTANDPDGDAITSLTASPLPAGATFTANGENTGGTFSWMPSTGQAGTFNVTFTASNALTGSATTNLTIAPATGGNDCPTVTAPTTQTVNEGSMLTFNVTATDPNGDTVALSATGLPTGSTFNDNSNSSGTFTWTPGSTQSGTFLVTFTGNDNNGCTVTATTLITVNDVGGGNDCPTVTVQATQSVNEGSLLTFTVNATDPDGDTVALSASDLPTGASFGDNLNNTGTFNWTPGSTQSGTYLVTFTGNDNNGCTVTATTLITVNDVGGGNQCPTITVVSTQSVNEGQALTFTVTANDPDGGDVTLTASGLPSGANFNDNDNNTGTFSWTPGFTQSGTFTVTFTVDDNEGCTQTATTVITVNDVTQGGQVPATATLMGAFNTHRRFLCFKITPVNGSFDLRMVDLSSVEISFGGNTVDAVEGKTRGACSNEADCEECDEALELACDKASHLRACFLMSDLRELFGENDFETDLANATITGQLSNGQTFVATLDAFRVAGNGGADQGKGKMRVKASPNPLNPITKLSFTLSKAGRVLVSVYDFQGRLVKTISDETRSVGDQSVLWDGTDSRSGKVASGVYFFRIQAPEGQEVQRVTVLK